MLNNSLSKRNLIPIILSGGVGSRLWPLSRSAFPKQYLRLDEETKNTLLQETYIRLKGLKNLNNPIIVCNEEQRFIAAEQMRQIKVEPIKILLEPFGRNTAPAITMAALIASEIENDPILLILSADHKIKNKDSFKKAIEEGVIFAENGRLVAFGIQPNTPETGYGYIESEKEITDKSRFSNIKRFIEKPTKDIAKKFIKNKYFSWNSGIFLFKASTILNELLKYEPDIFDICKKSLKNSSLDLNFRRIDKTFFNSCPNKSIDVAVMEKTNLGTVVKLDAGWDDLGSWKSVWENSKKDQNQNSLKGKTFIKDVKNSYLRSENRLLVGFGLDNLVVIETDDTVLVANKDSLNSMKDLIVELERENFEEIKINKRVHRPWGHFTSLIKEENWQVKRLIINSGESLSLQKHNFRAENWIVVKGIAKVEIDEKIYFLNPNESIYIPKGAKHRLSNTYKKTLEIIEVQIGSYLGEDDIIRFKDKYKREKS